MRSFTFSESEGVNFVTANSKTYRLRCKPTLCLDSDLNKVGKNAHIIVLDDIMTGIRYTPGVNPEGSYFTLNKFKSAEDAIENLELTGNSAEMTHTVYFLSGTTLGIADMSKYDIVQLLFSKGSGRLVYVKSNNTYQN